MRYSLVILIAALSFNPLASAEPPSVDSVARRIDLIQDVYGNRVEHMGPRELEAAYRSIDSLISEWKRLGKLAVWTDEGLGQRASASEVGGVDYAAVDSWRALQLKRLRSIPLTKFTDLRSDLNTLLKLPDTKPAVALLHLSPLLYWGDSHSLDHKAARERIEWGADTEETGRLAIMYLDYFEERLRDSATYAFYDSKAEALLPDLDKVSSSPELVAALTPIPVASLTIQKLRRVDSAFRRAGGTSSHGYLEGVHFYSITRGGAETPAGWMLVASAYPSGFNPEFRKPVPYIVETSLADVSPLESRLLIRAVAAAFESREVYLPEAHSLLTVDGLKTKSLRAILPRGWITADRLQRAGTGGPISEEVLERAITVSVASIGDSLTGELLPAAPASAKPKLSENADATLGALHARISRMYPGTDAYDNLLKIPSFKEIAAGWDLESLVEHNPPNGQIELAAFFNDVLKLRADRVTATAQRIMESLPAEQHIWCVRGIALTPQPNGVLKLLPPIAVQAIRNAFASEDPQHRQWAAQASLFLGEARLWPREMLQSALLAWEKYPDTRADFPITFIRQSLKALGASTWAQDPQGMHFVRMFMTSGRIGIVEDVAEAILTSPAWKKAPGIHGLVREFMAVPATDTYVSTFPDYFFNQAHWAEDPDILDYLLEYVLRRYTVEQVAFTHYVLGRSLNHAFWAEAPHGLEALEILLRGYRRQVWWDTGEYDVLAFNAITSEAWMKRFEKDLPDFKEWKALVRWASVDTKDWKGNADRKRAAIDWLKGRFDWGLSFRARRLTQSIDEMGIGVAPQTFLRMLQTEMPHELFGDAAVYLFMKTNEEAFRRGNPNKGQIWMFEGLMKQYAPGYERAQKRSVLQRVVRGCKAALSWLASSREIGQ